MPIINNANIRISNIFDIFKWIFESEAVAMESGLNRCFRLDSASAPNVEWQRSPIPDLLAQYDWLGYVKMH